MRVRRAQARLCGRDAHAPRGANLPPVSPSWERARVRVSRASSPRPAANERAIRVKRRAQPLRTGRLRLANMRTQASSAPSGALPPRGTQARRWLPTSPDTGVQRHVGPPYSVMSDHVLPSVERRRCCGFSPGGAGGGATIRACLRLAADTKWRFGESPRRS